MGSFIEIDGKMHRGVFRERPNRFLALVKVQNRILPAFLPNPGRMEELLTLGAEVLLKEAQKKNRKTDYDLIGVLYDGQRVSVDSRIPNRLVFEALKNGDVKELSMYNIIKPEYGYGHTRFDFFLTNEYESCLLEVKSCTLVKDGVAMFPDAVTERGRRHMKDLMKAKRGGHRACVLFIVQRTDAHLFAPNDETDPKFGEALREAVSKGVEAYAYYSEFAGNKITLKDRIPVELDLSQNS